MPSDTLAILPYGRQEIDDDDIDTVAAVLRGDWLTTGPTVERFEKALARNVGATYAIVCTSCTAGLHMAAEVAGISAGDLVVVPSVTFVATANAVRYAGGDVLFADVDPETGLMGPAQLEAALEKAGDLPVRAVMPVHLAGQCADPPAIANIADRSGLTVIEDAAHAIGGHYGAGDEAAAVGACRHSDMTVFSFHPVKTITMGEGGAVTTTDVRLARRLRRIRSHGMVRDPADFLQPNLALDRDGATNPWYAEMHELGYNYRATDIQCALGLSQLAKLDGFVARRRQLVARYDAQLAPLAPTVRPLGRAAGCDPGWHLYVVRIDFDRLGMDRAAVMNWLRDRGIGSQVHYLPVHMQPYYRRRYGEQSLPGAESYYRQALSLPLFPAMTDADVDRVCDALAKLVAIASLSVA